MKAISPAEAIAGPILFVGGGKMGAALAQGAVVQGRDAGQIYIIEPSEMVRASLIAQHSFQVFARLEDAPPDMQPDLIVLAIKPQVMGDILPAYRRFASSSLFISIAAGKTVAFLENYLGSNAAIIRAMPNTPAAIGKGVTAAVANVHANEAQKTAAENLLGSVGEFAWLQDESLMDAVTAVSGSGPAYVFLLIETLAEAGARQGLPRDLALAFARATVWGAGALAHETGEDPAQLRQNVTSPGGTTAAALSVLMAKPGLAELIDAAILAAVKRSQELA